MNKAITFLFAITIFSTMALAQTAVPDLKSGGSASNPGTQGMNSQIEDRITTEVQNLDARINMNSTQESAVTSIFRSAVNDVIATKERMGDDRQAYIAYKEQRIEQAIDEMEQHLTPSQFQGARAYAQQRGFNF